MHRLLIAPLVSILATSAECEPARSKHPLTDPKTAAAEHALDGVWRMSDEDDHIFAHFIPKPHNRLDLVLVGHDNSDELGVYSFSGFASRIGTQPYLSLKRVKSTRWKDFAKGQFDLADDFLIIKPELSKSNRLALFFLGKEAVAEAIAAKKVAGKGDYLIASTADLVRFFSKSDSPSLWKKFGEFDRIVAMPIEK